MVNSSSSLNFSWSRQATMKWYTLALHAFVCVRDGFRSTLSGFSVLRALKSVQSGAPRRQIHHNFERGSLLLFGVEGSDDGEEAEMEETGGTSPGSASRYSAIPSTALSLSRTERHVWYNDAPCPAGLFVIEEDGSGVSITDMFGTVGSVPSEGVLRFRAKAAIRREKGRRRGKRKKKEGKGKADLMEYKGQRNLLYGTLCATGHHLWTNDRAIQKKEKKIKTQVPLFFLENGRIVTRQKISTCNLVPLFHHLRGEGPTEKGLTGVETHARKLHLMRWERPHAFLSDALQHHVL